MIHRHNTPALYALTKLGCCIINSYISFKKKIIIIRGVKITSSLQSLFKLCQTLGVCVVSSKGIRHKCEHLCICAFFFEININNSTSFAQNVVHIIHSIDFLIFFCKIFKQNMYWYFKISVSHSLTILVQDIPGQSP